MLDIANASPVNPRAATDWDLDEPTSPGLAVETVFALLASLRPACPTCTAPLFTTDDGTRCCLSIACPAQAEAVIS